MYEIRKDYPFYMALKVFKYFWFFDLDPNKRHVTASDVNKIVLLVAQLILQVILPALHLIKVSRAYKDISSSEDIADLIGGAGFLLICYKTMYNSQHFNKVFRDLTDTTRFGKPKTFHTDTKYCKLVSTVSLFYAIVAATIYALVSVNESKHGACMRHQLETSKELYCMSVYPIWLPLKVNMPVVILTQLLSAWQLYAPSTQVSITIYEEVVILLSHINLLSFRLKNVFRVRKIEKRVRMLGFCAEYHSHIVNLAMEVNELHMKITGHMTLVWAISLGCITNQLLSMYKPLGASLFLGGYIMCFCCFAVSGQTLQEESKAIAEELYCTPWYLGTIEEQKIVMFMIMRAQIPLTLSAKPFGNYEYPLGIAIVKTAYSYLTLLQSTT